MTEFLSEAWYNINNRYNGGGVGMVSTFLHWFRKRFLILVWHWYGYGILWYEANIVHTRNLKACGASRTALGEWEAPLPPKKKPTNKQTNSRHTPVKLWKWLPCPQSDLESRLLLHDGLTSWVTYVSNISCDCSLPKLLYSGNFQAPNFHSWKHYFHIAFLWFFVF